MSYLLEGRGLYKEYDGETVLAGCDVAVEPGEVVALTGASGQGKSTLLAILGLLLTPSAGTVLVEGRSLEGAGDAELSAARSRSFGFVFQHTQLVGSLRALENVCVPACFAGRGGEAAVRGRAEELLERFGLGARMQHYPYQLSVGQKRRVALARALVLEPAVIVADEPTNDLDAASAAEVARALGRYARAEGHGVLLATHDDALVGFADRVLRLDDGRLSPVEGNCASSSQRGAEGGAEVEGAPAGASLGRFDEGEGQCSI